MEKRALRVTAGAGRACASVWVRPRAEPSALRMVTVAHVLFGRDGRPRAPVRVSAMEAEVVAVAPVVRSDNLPADAALLSLRRETANGSFCAADGHLNRFCPTLPVWRLSQSGERVSGLLAGEGWSGRLAYHFGARRLVGQWLIRLDAGGAHLRQGDSGGAWFTGQGVVVGLQVGVVRSRPELVIVTPFESVAGLFGVAVAR